MATTEENVLLLLMSRKKQQSRVKAYTLTRLSRVIFCAYL